MAFTYDPTEATDIDKVRGQIGDADEYQGPRPAGSGTSETNYQDEVITATIAQEKNWQRAVANMFERLAAEWAKKSARSLSSGGNSASFQYNDASARFTKLATEQRRRYGYVEDDDTVVEGVSTGVLRLGFQATNST
jgi:hypothetical protein